MRNRTYIAILLGVLPLLLSPTAIVEAAPDPILAHLTDGGFEQVSAQDPHLALNWSAYEHGYTLDPAVAHSGHSGIRCTATESTVSCGAECTQVLSQQTAMPILVEGWSRALGVDGGANSDYSLYVDVAYVDGTNLWAQNAPFDTGSHGWQRRSLLITPDKPVQSINVYALFRNHPGTVWFDDFDAREVPNGTLFDSQVISGPVLSKQVAAGWFIRDTRTGSALIPVAFSKALLGIAFTSHQAPVTASIVAAVLRNETHENRAVSLYYVERFAPRHAVWWNNIRSSVSAEDNGEHANLTPCSVGANGLLSLYPFGCVTGDRTGEALGVPPWLGPRVVRIGYNDHLHLLYIVFDMALTGAADPAGHDRASAAVTRYGVDPKWGFRDAAATYYRLFPASFQRRATKEGIWMPFTAPNTISSIDDFRVAYHEGDNSVDTDRAHGILSFRYVEPMTYWMSMPASAPRTYQSAVEMLQAQANDTGATQSTTRQQAQAVLYSGSRDQQGLYNVEFRDTPWCDGAVWILDPNPRISHPQGTATKAVLNTAGEPSPGQRSQPDGEYLDSLEAQADFLDYSTASLTASTLPLTFTSDNPSPTLPTWFSVYEAAASLSRDLHAHGKLIMANSVPWRFFAFAPVLDVMGTETNMFSESGAWAPEADGNMDLRRTLSYRKPYLLLMNTDFTKVGAAGIELYFERCLFYGIYPSMFSADAADQPYWENPQLYNRDRPLFEKYIPLIQMLSTAGWEPVTYAHSNMPSIWVERYGNHSFTILNSATTSASARISVDCGQLQIKSNGLLTARDLATSKSLLIQRTGRTATFTVRLQPSETSVVSIQ